MISFHDFILGSAELHFSPTHANTTTEVIPNITDDFSDLIPTGLCETWDCALTDEQIQLCPYSPKFARAVLEWFNQLHWPCGTPSGDPISLIELYADFVLTTGFSAPVQIVDKSKRSKGHKPKYAMRGDSLLADATSWCLSLQSRVWTRFFRWLVENSPSLDKLTIHTGYSLRRFGYRLGHASVPLRPRLVSGTESYQLLAGYFQISRGKRRNLSGTFNVSSLYSGELHFEWCIMYSHFWSFCSIVYQSHTRWTGILHK